MKNIPLPADIEERMAAQVAAKRKKPSTARVVFNMVCIAGIGVTGLVVGLKAIAPIMEKHDREMQARADKLPKQVYVANCPGVTGQVSMPPIVNAFLPLPMIYYTKPWSYYHLRLDDGTVVSPKACSFKMVV